MKILLVLAGFIGIMVGMLVRNNHNRKVIPVLRQVRYSDDKMTKTTFLHFGKPTTNPVISTLSEEKFYVKLKGNSHFCGKTIIRVDDLEEGTTRYDDNGYKCILEEKEMKRAFENVKKVIPTY